MARIIAWDIISLDGFFEGNEPWDLRHHEYIWGADLRELSLQIGQEVGLLVFGRKTYQGMAQHWPTDTIEPEIARYMNEVPKLVASHTMTTASWQHTEVTDDIELELRHRRISDDRSIYIFGSAALVDSLLSAGLIDELMIGVAPVVLGSGNPFFKTHSTRRELTLLETRTIDTGGVILRYAPEVQS